MADYYRAAIKTGLKEYAKSIGKTYPEQLYESLAWVGLQGTKAWNNMYSDSAYTKYRQKQIIDAQDKFIKSGSNECQ